MLKEYSTNKQTVAETLLKLGDEGEKSILKILNDNSDSDYRLKSSILKSLEIIDLKSQNIEPILDIIFKLAQYHYFYLY